MPLAASPIRATNTSLRTMMKQSHRYNRFKIRLGRPFHPVEYDDLRIPFADSNRLWEKSTWKGNALYASFDTYPTRYLRAAMHAAIKGWATTVCYVRALPNHRWFWELAYPAKVRFILGRFRDFSGFRIRAPMMLVTYAPYNVRHLNADHFLERPEDARTDSDSAYRRRIRPKPSPLTYSTRKGPERDLTRNHPPASIVGDPDAKQGGGQYYPTDTEDDAPPSILD